MSSMASDLTLDDRLRAGRDAASRRAWPEAHDLLSANAAEIELEPEDLELLAKAAWWTGHPGESIEQRERAYAGYVERGDRARAAFMALTLRREYSAKLQGSVANGWLSRAQELLSDQSESPSHAYLALAHGELAASRGEFDHALEHFEVAVATAQAFEDSDLRAWALMRKGMTLISAGRMDEGWAHMEEVSASAVGGELGAYTTGATFCNVIATCRDLADWGRASEWADAAKRWCERQSITGFPGVCRVHRAEIMRLLGAWTEAESEVQKACDELYEFSPVHAGAAFHELGEVRLRMGDLASADEAFRQAQGYGEDPQPGRSLLLLAEGKVESAAASIRRSLEEADWDRLARARRLPAQVAIAWTAGDVETARSAAEELESIAEEYPTAAIRAEAAASRGTVALLEQDPEAAIRGLHRARQLWREVDAPYEGAVSSMVLAEAYLLEEDRESARLELESARATFERLGAAPDVARADARLQSLRPASGGSRVQRTFMFTDIVGSTALIEAIGDEAWTDLRRWHDEALRACFAQHGGEEIDHAGDGFFLAFPDASAAVGCAVEVQRKLAEHRQDHGFAPGVRIGLHADEATQAGAAYTGRGVHTAARVAVLAGAGEIVVTGSTLEGLAGIATAGPREVELKGISGPVRVVTVDWR